MWAVVDSNNFKIYDISQNQYIYPYFTTKWVEWADSPEDFNRENIKLWRYTSDGIFVRNIITTIQEPNTQYALISPASNNCVIQIEESTFDVAAPFFWVGCPDSCKRGMFYINGEFVNYVPPPPVAMENKITAINLLKDTDWSTYSDVVNTSRTPHLINQNEFIEYRTKVRIISLNPTDGNLVWPVKPIEIWSESPSGTQGLSTIEVLREIN